MNKEPGAPGAHTCRACGADAAACALDAALAGQRRWLCRGCEQAAACRTGRLPALCRTRPACGRALVLQLRALPTERFAAGKGRCAWLKLTYFRCTAMLASSAFPRLRAWPLNRRVGP
jgi:hypothetical protein